MVSEGMTGVSVQAAELMDAAKSSNDDRHVKSLKVEAADVKEYSSIEDGSVAAVSKERLPDLFDRLTKVVEDHQFDLNFPPDLLARARSVLSDQGDDLSDYESQKLLSEIEEVQQFGRKSSPYAEVSSLVPPTDDPTTPINTFRVWVLGTIFSILGSGLNKFFSYRYPGITINSYVAQLLSYPCGVAMARYLPTRKFTLSGWSMTLNPGPFNQKEHILITVMAVVSFGNGGTYVTDVFTVLKLDYFFGEKVMADSAAFRILLALSSQLLGYGCAGIARRFLVYPSTMIWPICLSQIALNKALHHDDGGIQVPGWKITRFRFFLYCFIGMFFYFWLPGYLFQALSFFNWITWISPNNVTLALVTGSFCGLGLNPWPTFDWNVVTSLIDPIITPFFSTLNSTIGLAMAAFIIIPLLYWNNVVDSAYMPVTSNTLYDNMGQEYNVSRVLNPDYTLNVTAYEAYSAPYMGAGLSIFFTTAFAMFPALIVHVLLYHGPELKTRVMALVKRKGAREDDIHNTLMKTYREAPTWWYAILLAISFTMACIVCVHYHTGLPVWVLLITIIMPLLLQIPIGMLFATTNIYLSLNVFSEIISGYILPERPIALLIFKSLGIMGTSQAVSFCQDLKLGHYLKIPPRTMFAAQVYATVLGVFVDVGVNAWQLDNIKDFCQPNQSADFTCPGLDVFFSSAIIWGLVGPKRLFSSGGFYSHFQWAWLVGAVLPIPFWLLSRKFPNSWLRYIHIPLIIHGISYIAPFGFSFLWPACIFGFVFNYYIKRRYKVWWLKYAYVLAGAFNVGIAISAIVIFFAVQYHEVSLSWWGNNVPFAGVDGGAENAPSCVLKTLAEGARFPGT